VLQRHLGFRYDCHSIRKAPEPVRRKSGDLGDLCDSQLLLATIPKEKSWSLLPGGLGAMAS